MMNSKRDGGPLDALAVAGLALFMAAVAAAAVLLLTGCVRNRDRVAYGAGAEVRLPVIGTKGSPHVSNA